VQAGSGVQWAMSELPVDYTFWLEQGMDPTHANFLHHTCGYHWQIGGLLETAAAC
jgi:phenylpropionate dioxygenase-like ring-hydroxylating dioxygenase large terminal subunit